MQSLYVCTETKMWTPVNSRPCNDSFHVTAR